MTITDSARRRLPHWLALVAVLVQLIASFGHLHPEDFAFLLAGHHAPALTADSGPWRGSSAAIAPDADCAVCASVLMLGGTALPDAFVLPVPSASAAAAPTKGDELWLMPPRHLLFSTRAPPSV